MHKASSRNVKNRLIYNQCVMKLAAEFKGRTFSVSVPFVMKTYKEHAYFSCRKFQLPVPTCFPNDDEHKAIHAGGDVRT